MELIIHVTDEPTSVMIAKNLINVCLKRPEDLLVLINDRNIRKNLLEEAKGYMEMYSDIDSMDTEIEDFEFAKNLSTELTLADFEEITFSFTMDINPLEFKALFESFNNNIYINVSKLSNQNILKLEQINFKQEPFINSEYNSFEVSLTEMIETIKIIESMKNTINKYLLSPLEQLILLYDQIKEKIYKDSASPYNSRDLTRVLKGEEIVCLGYSRIFKAVANALGIKTEEKRYVRTTDETRGHATVISYIDDPVYNYHGILEFDPTWDSKKDINDTEYIKRYYWFGFPASYSELLKRKLNLEAKDSYEQAIKQGLNNYLDFAYQMPNSPMSEYFSSVILKKLHKLYAEIRDPRGLKLLSQIDQNVLESKDLTSQIVCLVDYTKNLLKQKLSYESFLKMLYRVRRIEHYLNPEKYPLTLDEITRTAKSRNSRESLLMLIYLEDLNEYLEISSLDVMKNIPEDVHNKINYDAKRMELLHILKKKANDKHEKQI